MAVAGCHRTTWAHTVNNDQDRYRHSTMDPLLQISVTAKDRQIWEWEWEWAEVEGEGEVEEEGCTDLMVDHFKVEVGWVDPHPVSSRVEAGVGQGWVVYHLDHLMLCPIHIKEDTALDRISIHLVQEEPVDEHHHRQVDLRSPALVCRRNQLAYRIDCSAHE